MKLICPNCGEFVPGPDIDLRRSLAVCRLCSDIVPLPSVVTRDADGTLRCEGTAVLTAHEICALPLYAYRPENSGLSERRQGQRVVLSLPDDRSGALLVAVVAAVWCALLPLWPDTMRNPDGRKLLALWVVFALIHLVSAGALVFLALRGLLNHTSLSLSPQRFALSFEPLGRRGAISEPLRDIRCFIETSVHITTLPERWFRPPLGHDVMMLTRDQRSVPLNLIFNQRDHARYLALRLNRALDEMRALEPRPGTVVEERPADAPGEGDAEAEHPRAN